MLTARELQGYFKKAMAYEAYVTHAKPHERPGWEASAARVQLTAEQRGLVAGFSRRINVLCISGTWCGDCVQQCPMLHRIAEPAAVAVAAPPGAPGIDLRFLEREANLDFAEIVSICGGHRVPTVVFMNEDFEFVSLLGDRTLARYRAIAKTSLGPACPMPVT